MKNTKQHDDARVIQRMHTYARPMGSTTEDAFIDHFLTPVGFQRDRFFNLVLEIPEQDGARAKVLFSSHVDTVARQEGFQSLHYDGHYLGLSRRSRNAGFGCLGADDTAGIWLMLELIKAGTAGVYVIHHGEEMGCIGSTDLAIGDPDFFAGIDIALAFDRAGYDDVITHQMGQSSASEGFAWSLARQLGGNFKPSSAGVYTDTAEYTHLVPECSNLSVGYFDQHTSKEALDVPFLISLRDKLVKVEWNTLNVERTPEARWLGTGDDWRHDSFWQDSVLEPETNSRTSFMQMISDYPDVAEDMLRDLGYDGQDFAEAVYDLYGIIPKQRWAS